MVNTYVEFLKQRKTNQIDSINYTKEDKKHFETFLLEIDKRYPSIQKKSDLEMKGHYIAAKNNFLAMVGTGLCTALLTTGIVLTNVTDLPVDSHWSWYLTDIVTALGTAYF